MAAIPEDERPLVAAYLSSGSVVLACRHRRNDELDQRLWDQDRFRPWQPGETAVIDLAPSLNSLAEKDTWSSAMALAAMSAIEAGSSADVDWDDLRSGTVIFALMSYTQDVLEGRFGVSGGSGVLTDGRYYWRRDAAEYVLEYGIAVDTSALAHMRQQAWVAPALDRDCVAEIDSDLVQRLRRR